MDLPDFDTLKRLAETEPGRLDELLHQQVEALLEGVNPEWQRCLRGLQFRIDCQRRLAKNPMDSCLRISSMMHDSFYNMRCALNTLYLKQDTGSTPIYQESNVENNRGDNIVTLMDYPHRKK